MCTKSRLARNSHLIMSKKYSVINAILSLIGVVLTPIALWLSVLDWIWADLAMPCFPVVVLGITFTVIFLLIDTRCCVRCCCPCCCSPECCELTYHVINTNPGDNTNFQIELHEQNERNRVVNESGDAFMVFSHAVSVSSCFQIKITI